MAVRRTTSRRLTFSSVAGKARAESARANRGASASTRCISSARGSRRMQRQAFAGSTSPQWALVNSMMASRARQRRLRNAAGEMLRIFAASTPSSSRISPRIYVSRCGRSSYVSSPCMQPTLDLFEQQRLICRPVAFVRDVREAVVKLVRELSNVYVCASTGLRRVVMRYWRRHAIPTSKSDCRLEMIRGV